MIGKYQHKPELPYAPLVEGSGEVLEVGSAAAGRFAVGDRVLFLTWLGGASSSELVLDERSVFALPPTFSLAEGAALPVGFVTAFHALAQRGQVQQGEFLLVTGASGGMGTLACLVGAALGARVIAACSSAERCATVMALGCVEATVIYGKNASEPLKTQVMRVTEGHGADLCYEVVGGAVFHDVVRCMAGRGRLLVVGFASGTIPSLAANLCLVKGFSLVGVRSGAEFLEQPDLETESNMAFALMLRTSPEKLRPLVGACVPLEGTAVRGLLTQLSTGDLAGKGIICISGSVAENTIPLAKL